MKTPQVPAMTGVTPLGIKPALKCPIKITITDLDGVVLGIYDLSLLNEEEIIGIPEDIEHDIEIYAARAKRGQDLATGRITPEQAREDALACRGELDGGAS
jgi:hypothetical protein